MRIPARVQRPPIHRELVAASRVAATGEQPPAPGSDRDHRPATVDGPGHTDLRLPGGTSGLTSPIATAIAIARHARAYRCGCDTGDPGRPCGAHFGGTAITRDSEVSDLTAQPVYAERPYEYPFGRDTKAEWGDPVQDTIADAVAQATVPKRNRTLDDLRPDPLRLKLREIQSRAVLSSEISDHDLPTLPGFDSISLACRYLPSDGDLTGRDRFVIFVQRAALDGEEAAVKWWLVYADLTVSERQRVSFDDVTVAAGVKPSILMATVVRVAMEHGQEVAELVAASTHPEIVAQTIASAKRIDGDYAEIGYKDRLLLLQHARFAAMPKGMSVHVHANASANANAAAASAVNPSVPSFMDDVDALRATRQHLLTTGSAQRSIAAADTDLDPIDAMILEAEAVPVTGPLPAIKR